jgi:hypothetical protein
MPQSWTISSFSLKRETAKRLKVALPRHGDRSRLIAKLLEMWLDGRISLAETGLILRSQPHLPAADAASAANFNVAQHNTNQWQQP